MVFVDPDTFVISPSQPTDSTDLSFSFKGVRDPVDFVALLYTPVFYVMYRTTRPTLDKTGWFELARIVQGIEYVSTLIQVDATKKLPAGKYDFMAVEMADWNGTGRDNPTRIGYKTVTIARDCSDPTVLCTAGCISQATCAQCPTAPNCGSVCDDEPCNSVCPNANTPTCQKTECDIMCQFETALEPIMPYVPYVVAGVIGLVLITVLFKKKPKKPVDDGMTTNAALLAGLLLGKGEKK